MSRALHTLCLTVALALIAVSTASAQAPRQLATATLAGGCFWCVEADFDKLPGVVSTTSGYLGGRTANPTYEQVSTGRTGHFEAVQIVYDPTRVSYAQLLEHFWVNIDPTVDDRQFCDVGPQYRAAIFVHDDEQRRIAESSKAALEKTKPFAPPIKTPILPATAFTAAEAYHQDYYLKNPLRYRYYRTSCGRDARLKQLWGDLARP
jgi:peptide-methionine (S)-S-oxide reductase